MEMIQPQTHSSCCSKCQLNNPPNSRNLKSMIYYMRKTTVISSFHQSTELNYLGFAFFIHGAVLIPSGVHRSKLCLYGESGNSYAATIAPVFVLSVRYRIGFTFEVHIRSFRAFGNIHKTNSDS